MGLGSRALFERVQAHPFFIQTMNNIASCSLVPVAGGGVTKFDETLVGAVGIALDISGNDAACAIAATGFTADGG